jgi:molybdenum cofactor biosynthesis enzyme MoaA
MSQKRIYTKKLGTRVAVSARPVNSRKYHVITGDGQKWTVVADGNTKATRVFTTKIRAIEFARETADKIEGEVIIHKKTGEIEERVSLAK